MDNIHVPVKVTWQIDTYDGDWTEEEIALGWAGKPREVETKTSYFKPSPDGPVEYFPTQETDIEGD